MRAPALTNIQFKMKKTVFILVLFLEVIATLQAQVTKEIIHRELSKEISFDKLIPPYELAVTFDKTVHLIFPSPIRYIDLGSANIIAGKADAAENVIRVKAAVRNFRGATNFSVITEEGSFYSFNVRYVDEPLMLNVEMKDFIHDGDTLNCPSNTQEVYLKELGEESPKLVQLIMKSIYTNDRREIKHISCKYFGVKFSLKGIYTCDGLLYFHTQIKNSSNVPFDIDFILFKIVDKKLMKRTAIQETVIQPLRTFNNISRVNGKSNGHSVFTLEKFTIPDDKQLVIELLEKNGGRHQRFVVENRDIVKANIIDDLKVK